MYFINRNLVLIIAMFSAMFSTMCFAGSAAEKTLEKVLEKLSADKEGSPYQWVTVNLPDGTKIMERELMGTVGPSVADELLKADVLKSIGKSEEKLGGSNNPKLVEVRFLPNNQDEFNEIWTISRSGEHVVYTVSMKPDPKRGMRIVVNGPWD